MFWRAYRKTTVGGKGFRDWEFDYGDWFETRKEAEEDQKFYSEKPSTGLYVRHCTGLECSEDKIKTRRVEDL